MKSLTLITLLSAALLGSATTVRADSAIPKDYPLKTCPVSDEKLGEHGKPVKVTHEGTDVWLCCKSCVKDFNKNPAKFTKAVKDAAPKK